MGCSKFIDNIYEDLAFVETRFKRVSWCNSAVMGISFWVEVPCSAVACSELECVSQDRSTLAPAEPSHRQAAVMERCRGWMLRDMYVLAHVCSIAEASRFSRIPECWNTAGVLWTQKTSVSCQRDMLGPEENDSLQVPAIQIISLEDIDSPLIMQETWIEITVLCSEWDASWKATEKTEWQVLSAVCSIALVLSLCGLRTCLVHAMVAFRAAAQVSFFGNLKMWEGNLKKMISSLVLFWCGTRLSVEYTYGNREKLQDCICAKKWSVLGPIKWNGTEQPMTLY